MDEELIKWSQLSGMSMDNAAALVNKLGFGIVPLDGDMSNLSEDNVVLMHRRDVKKLAALVEGLVSQPSAKPKVLRMTRGQEAYERRAGGESWRAIGGRALMAAKYYAKQNELPWPVGRAV